MCLASLCRHTNETYISLRVVNYLNLVRKQSLLLFLQSQSQLSVAELKLLWAEICCAKSERWIRLNLARALQRIMCATDLNASISANTLKSVARLRNLWLTQCSKTALCALRNNSTVFFLASCENSFFSVAFFVSLHWQAKKSAVELTSNFSNNLPS